MAKTKENIKDLKNIGSFGFSKLTMWGMIGAVILLAFSIVSAVFHLALNVAAIDLIFNIVGLVLGVLYAVLGVFGIVKVVKKQEGSFWGLFLVASIFAVLSPLAWFGWGGVALSILAGITFLIYYLLEKK